MMSLGMCGLIIWCCRCGTLKLLVCKVENCHLPRKTAHSSYLADCLSMFSICPLIMWKEEIK